MIRASSGRLVTINTGFRANFMTAFGAASATATYKRIATVVPSTTKSNEYGWLKSIPGIREWLGDRHVNALAEDGYTLKNKKFENTIGVKGDDINDDQVGLYKPVFEMLGDEVARFPDLKTYATLKAGLANSCYDGQYFFDTDHPYIKADGTTGVQANLIAGAGAPWFLLCTTRPLKPMIYQEREPFNFVALDRPDDPNVFMKDELLYGVDGRMNVGYGFWQMALCCTDTMNSANVKALRLLGQKLLKDNGAPFNLKYDLFVGGNDFADAANALFNVPTLTGGAANELYKAFDILIDSNLD